MNAIYYLSHPEVVIDPVVPVPDWSLSTEGRARILAIRNAGWVRACRRVVTSAERKAVETAELIAEDSDAAIEVRPAMHENDRSATGFLPASEFEAVADQFFARPEASVRGWECARDAQTRILAEFNTVTAAHDPAQSLLLVGHGGVGTLLYCALAGCPIDRCLDQPRAGSVIVIQSRDHHPRFGWLPMEEVAARLLTG